MHRREKKTGKRKYKNYRGRTNRTEEGKNMKHNIVLDIYSIFHVQSRNVEHFFLLVSTACVFYRETSQRAEGRVNYRTVALFL